VRTIVKELLEVDYCCAPYFSSSNVIVPVVAKTGITKEHLEKNDQIHQVVIASMGAAAFMAVVTTGAAIFLVKRSKKISDY